MTRTPGSSRPHRPPVRDLADLARGLGAPVPAGVADVRVSGLTSRAQEVEPGDVFAALPGAAVHGARFAADAAALGAVALLTDPAGAEAAGGTGLPVLVVPDPRQALGPAAAWLHRTAERLPLLLGVTGTNGKTTTVHLLEHLLERTGTPAGVSSTAARGSAGEHEPSRLTTPEADELHAALARMTERGVRAAAVEVSAQALVRGRVGGLVFDVAGFTNLTHDHLDDFGTMEAYLAAKARLLEPGISRQAVVVLDSPAARALAADVRIPLTTLSSDPGVEADWRVQDVVVSAEGTRFGLRGPEGRALDTAVNLIGAHQAVDAALAMVMLVTAGVPLSTIGAAVADGGIRLTVPGRLERVPGSVDPAVWIDVGHTPDALEKSLRALRPLTAGPLVVLFGADGDRDPTKRAPMGALAAALADVVLVHDHHSRFEDPDRIRAAVLAGAAAGPAAVHEVRDPVEALRLAIGLAGAGGAVLWAGTGRTAYRDVQGVKHPFSFWDEAVAAVGAPAAEPVPA